MSKHVHLTSGPITGQLIRLCLPLLAANVLQQLYNIINSLVVTYYIGGDAFAALGVAESVMNLFIYVITGACMGSSVLVARFFGEENFPRLRQQLFVSGVLIGGTVLAAVSLTLLFLNPLLVLIQTPPELMGYVTDYLRIILVGMVFTFAYNYLAATLRAIGNTQAALFFLLISLGYNLGAGQPKRILEAQKYTLLLSLAYTTTLCLMGLLLAAPFTHIFTPDPQISALAVTVIRIFSIGVIPLAVQYTIVEGLNGMGMMQFSLPLSFFRKAVYFAALFTLPATFGAASTFWAEPISDLIPPLVTALFYWRKLGWIQEQALSHRTAQDSSNVSITH